MSKSKSNDNNLLFVLALGFGFLLAIEIATKLLRDFVSLNMSTRLNIQIPFACIGYQGYLNGYLWSQQISIHHLL